MKARPRELWMVAFALISIALSFPIQVFMLLDGPPMSFVLSRGSLTSLNWTVILLALLNASFVFQGSRVLIPTSLVFLFAVVWNNWLVADAGLNYAPWAAWGGVVATIALHGLLLREGPLTALLKPQQRWWRTPKRKRSSIQAAVYPVSGGELFSRTFDVSEGGAFVTLDSGSWDSAFEAPLKNIAPGSHCAVRLKLDQLNVLNCNAKIVRRARECGAYPEGFALQFVNLSSGQKRALRAYVSESETRALV